LQGIERLRGLRKKFQRANDFVAVHQARRDMFHHQNANCPAHGVTASPLLSLLLQKSKRDSSLLRPPAAGFAPWNDRVPLSHSFFGPVSPGIRNRIGPHVRLWRQPMNYLLLKWARHIPRSEEHTSELQSLAYLVCRLLLEKKKTK